MRAAPTAAAHAEVAFQTGKKLSELLSLSELLHPTSHPPRISISGSQEMSDESSALDALYKASTTLVGVNAKLSKEGVDEFAAVSHPLR